MIGDHDLGYHHPGIGIETNIFATIEVSRRRFNTELTELAGNNDAH